MRSINFALVNAAKRITEWNHDWEKAYVLGSDDYVFRNTFKDIRYILETMGGEGSKFEHECYDVGHLQSGLFRRSGAGEGAILHPVHFRRHGRNRARSRQSHVHEADGRSLVWRGKLSLVGAGGGQVSDAVHYAGGPDGRKCARWAGGQSFH